jgi:YggT family protein
LVALLFNIIEILLDVVWWIIVVQVILSILISFNVINTYNDFVRALWQGLERLTEPLYRPIRRILPDARPLDLAPMAVLILMLILRTQIMPYIAMQLVANGIA